MNKKVMTSAKSSLAERFAKERGIKMQVFRPDWSKGKDAGLNRNTDISFPKGMKAMNSASSFNTAATHVLALPTASSKGTWDSIAKARLQGKSLKIVKV